MTSTSKSCDAPKSILVIDDNLTELRVIVSMLRSAGYNMIIADNGKDGLARASVLKPDMILCDVRMPDMSGFAVIRRIKADPTTEQTPFIFLTSCAEIEDRIVGLRLGAVDYITKPAHADEVLLRVGIHINQIAKSKYVQDSSEDPREARGLTRDEAILRACLELIDNDLPTTMSIEELAASVGTHRKRLTEIFRAKYGTTVYAFIRDRCMLTAQEYLKNEQMSIQTLAELLGFTSAANFATAFKERFSVSPSEYRKIMLGNQH